MIKRGNAICIATLFMSFGRLFHPLGVRRRHCSDVNSRAATSSSNGRTTINKKETVAEKKPRKKKYTADDFAGMWSDEYFMDVDELNKLIRDGRHVKSNRDKIWDEL